MNRYRHYCAGLPQALEQLARVEKVFMPFVTLAELRGLSVWEPVQKK